MRGPSPYQLFVGIDVAAATFTVSWSLGSCDPGKPSPCRRQLPAIVICSSGLRRPDVRPVPPDCA